VLANAMNLLLGCSKAVSAWDLGNRICTDLEAELLFNNSTLSTSAFLMLMVAATVVDCNFFMAKIIAGALIFDPILLVAHWTSVKIDGHGVPIALWFVLGFVVGTFAIAAVMGLKGEVSAEPKSLTFGALNKWAFGIGGSLFLAMSGTLSLGCDQAIENWGFGKYDCNTLEALALFMLCVKTMQVTVILIMVATTTANKTDLLKLSAPMIFFNFVQLVSDQRFVINGHSVPDSVYVMYAIVFTSFFIAVTMHNSASARQVNPTGYEPLVAA